MGRRGDNDFVLRVSVSPHLRVRGLEAMKGVEPLSTGLQDRRSGFQLSYIARSEFGGLGGIQTLTRSLQDFYALGYITSPRKFRVLCFEFRVRDALVLELETRNSKLIVGGCGWSRTTNLALMRRLLCST